MKNNKSNNKRNKKSAKSRKNKSRRSRAPLHENEVVRLTEIGRFCPNRLVCRLIYNDYTLSRTSTGSVMNWAYRSSAYDPDPSLSTGSIPGYVELANLYQQYLVHKMTLNITLGNQNLQNCLLAIWPSNVIQSVNTLAVTDIMEYSSNPNSVRDMIPVSNGGTVSYTVRAVGLKLYGRQFITDAYKYASAVGSNPTYMYGINIGIADGTGVSFTYPVIVKAAITYDIEFFGLRQLES